MTAVMPSGTPSQTTDYIYGVAGGASGIFSNDLLAKVEYPNATTGAASTAATDDVSYAYDALGETTGMTDQNGTTHAYSHDVLGRQTLDAVTTLGSGVDGSVMAIGTTYNSQGLPYQETSYANANGTGVVNQDQDVYNGLGQLTGEYQSVSGAVNTSTTPEVQYGYSDPSLGSRQTTMTYPNGRVLDYVYSSGIDTTIGRVSAIADAGGSAAGTDQSYTYQGLDMIVGNTDGNGVTETTTLDNFGRTAEMDYVNLSTGVSTDDFQYGYDRDGNVLYKNNLLDSSESELYHANSTTTGDDNSAYDPLNRLTGFERGTLSSSGNNGSTLDTVASPGTSQSWNLNAVGDQSSVTSNGTTTTNSTNAKNELTTNGASSLTFDNNGNETTDENGQTTTYDAWNRAITVKNAAGVTVAGYSYDPTGRRVTEAGAGTTTDIYFTDQWQDIEERQGGTVTHQNVWGLGYVNQLIERDDNSTAGNLGITGSGLGERLYVQQDANWNVTSLVNTSGNVVERMVYSPYGIVTFLTPSWATTADAYSQSVLFQGGRFEAATGDYSFDRRDYDPATGIWREQDPAGYIDGANQTEFVTSRPVSHTDPVGMQGATTQPAPPVVSNLSAVLNFLKGNLAHEVISAKYAARYGEDYLNNATLRTIAAEQGGNPNRLIPFTSRMRPDIDQDRLGDVYEIKSSQTGANVAFGIALLEVMSLVRAGVCKTTLGPSNDPAVSGSQYTIYGWLVWDSPEPGVILYTYLQPPKPVIAPIAVPVPQAQPAPQLAPVPVTPSQPWYKNGYFWTAAGVAGAAALIIATDGAAAPFLAPAFGL